MSHHISNDSGIGLMANHMLHGFQAISGLFQNLLDAVRDDINGKEENPLSIHYQVVQLLMLSCTNSLSQLLRILRAILIKAVKGSGVNAGGHNGIISLRAQVGSVESLGISFHHSSSCSVSENDGSGSVLYFQ